MNGGEEGSGVPEQSVVQSAARMGVSDSPAV